MIVRTVLSRREMRVGGPLSPGAALVVARYKINPGKAGVLADYDRTISAPIAQELVKSGKILSFNVTRPMFVGASTLDYDYTVALGVPNYVAAMTDLRALFRETFGKIFPNKSWNEPAKLLTESRQHVRDELWRLIDTAR